MLKIKNKRKLKGRVWDKSEKMTSKFVPFKTATCSYVSSRSSALYNEVLPNYCHLWHAQLHNQSVILCLHTDLTPPDSMKCLTHHIQYLTLKMVLFMNFRQFFFPVHWTRTEKWLHGNYVYTKNTWRAGHTCIRLWIWIH